MNKTYILLFSALLLMSCSNNQKKKIVASPDVKIIMAESMQRFSDAWNKGNAEMISEEFTNDAIRVISNPISPIIGKKRISESFKLTF